MSRTHWYAIGVTAVALLGGFGIFQACMGPAVDDASLGVAPGDVDPGDLDPPPMMSLDGGFAAPPDDPTAPRDLDQQAPDPSTPTTCAGTTCARGERCCVATGSCVPEDCADCCPFHEAELPAPTLEVPEVGGGVTSPVPPPPEPLTPPGPGPRPGIGAPGTGPNPPPPSPE